ncbi:MAG: hypothetical protein R2873_36105 [Caldilineaceae bacterium]
MGTEITGFGTICVVGVAVGTTRATSPSASGVFVGIGVAVAGTPAALLD